MNKFRNRNRSTLFCSRHSVESVHNLLHWRGHGGRDTFSRGTPILAETGRRIFAKPLRSVGRGYATEEKTWMCEKFLDLFSLALGRLFTRKWQCEPPFWNTGYTTALSAHTLLWSGCFWWSWLLQYRCNFLICCQFMIQFFALHYFCRIFLTLCRKRPQRTL